MTTDRSINPEAAECDWRFLVSVACVAGVLLATVISINLLVDPFGLRSGFERTSFRAYSTESGSRTAKAELARHEDAAVVLLGSSRVEVGFDPRHPALASFAGERGALNLGLIGSTVYEADRMLSLVLQDEPPALVVIGLDMILFNAQRDTWADFSKSRLNPDRLILEHFLDAVMSERATRASVRTILASSRGRESLFDDAGFRARGQGDESNDAQTAIVATLRRTLSQSDGLRYFRYDAARMDEVRAMIQRARDSGAEVVVILNGIHLLELEIIDRLGLWDAFEQFKRDASTLPAIVVDFAWANEFSIEPIPPSGPMRWWWEHSHFRREYGDIMLDESIRALSGDEIQAGVIIGPQTIDAWLSESREQFLRERRGNSGSVALVDTLFPQREDTHLQRHD